MGLLPEAAVESYAAERMEEELLGLVSTDGLAAEVRRVLANLQCTARSSKVCHMHADDTTVT